MVRIPALNFMRCRAMSAAQNGMGMQACGKGWGTPHNQGRHGGTRPRESFAWATSPEFGSGNRLCHGGQKTLYLVGGGVPSLDRRPG